MDAGRALHDVLAGKVVAACLEHGDHGLCHRVAVNGPGVGDIGR
jgi:hypothetical protein